METVQRNKTKALTGAIIFGTGEGFFVVQKQS